MAFLGSDFYVAQAYKGNSAILQFSGVGSTPLIYVGQFATPANLSGLLHPYGLAFDSNGNLFVSSQDTNVVSAFYGPASATPGAAMPLSNYLTQNYASGGFYGGTFVPAYQTAPDIPPSTSVSAPLGLSFSTDGKTTHSVRGIAFDANGYLYVADEPANQVTVVAADGSYLGAITGVSGPVGLFFDAASQLLYIGSPGNQSVYSYDTSNAPGGSFTATQVLNDSDLDKVSGIALDSSGNIYTGDRKSNKIHMWSGKGYTTKTTFAGAFTDSPEQLIPLPSAS